MWFDPATKKLAIKYHEYGVAYRNYYLKEGDQGSGTLVYSNTNNTNVSLTNDTQYWTLMTSIDCALTYNTAEAIIKLRLTGSGIALYINYGSGNLAIRTAQTSPVNLLQIANGANPVDVELHIVYGKNVVINGHWRSNNGAWQQMFGANPGTFGNTNYWNIWGRTGSYPVNVQIASCTVTTIPIGA